MMCFLGCFCLPLPTYAESIPITTDTLFVLKSNGTLDIFPAATIKSATKGSGSLLITTKNGTKYKYALSDLESYDHQLKVAKPTITSFKFNNKFNHQLFTDVECEITDNHEIKGEIAAIGHWLTPSFKRADKRAEVYLDGDQQLVSKYSRVKLGAEHTITVAYPGIQVLKSIMLTPGEEGEEIVEKYPIALSFDMLSTNAPSNYPDREGLDKLIDDDPSTFFHSTWGTGAYPKLPEDDFPYIDVALPEPVHNLVCEMTNRTDTGTRSPEVISLMTSSNGTDWVESYRFMEATGFSSAQGATNSSPVLEFEQPCSHVRIMMLKANYKNYFCLSELKLYTATTTKGEGTEATYEEVMQPFGTDYALKLDWKVATGVPRVELEIEYGDIPASKTNYNYGQITIDGAGFYPSLESQNIYIKGRGNSSWSSNYYSKNPYRLKFLEKVKPFGLKNGKNWVLLANRQSGSMMTNAIGMYASGLIGADGANHIVPVDLYMNGMYWGSYNFTEKVGLANNSIDLEDESKACRIELDTYSDEMIYYSNPYRVPVKIKEPDFDEDETDLESYEQIMDSFNAFTQLVKNGEDISSEVDVESMARFLVADELILNCELFHPKSTFLYHENVLEDTCKWKWGPMWDLDWSYGYEKSHSYFLGNSTDNYWTSINMEATSFISKMRKCGEPLDRAMYKYWTRFMHVHLQELIDYCDEYYAFAKPSLENNNNQVHRSNLDYTNYASSTENAKRWLRQRAQSVYAKLTPYEMTEDEILGIPEDEDEETPDTPFYTDKVTAPATPTFFEVYNLQGVKLKSRARYNEWRNGLAPGIYIVNGKKVLVQ